MLTAAGGLLVVLPMIFFFMRDSPAQSGLRPYGLPEGDPVIAPDSVQIPLPRQSPPWAPVCVHAISGSWRAVFSSAGRSTNGLIGTHLVPACMGHGMPEVRAAGLLAVMEICLI